MPELRGYPKREKKKRAAKRKLIEYDEMPPEMCQNCAHFKQEFVARSELGRERFPPRCEKHQLEVKKHAHCKDWEEGEI